MSAVKPGWYREPASGRERWWDGSNWGAYVDAAPAPPAPNTVDGEGNSGLVAAGYIFAVLLPLVGFILGIVAVTRPGRRTRTHGAWIIVLSCIVFIAVIVLIAAAANDATSQFNHDLQNLTIPCDPNIQTC